MVLVERSYLVDVIMVMREMKWRGSIGLKLLFMLEIGVLVFILVLCVVIMMFNKNFLIWKYIFFILMGFIFIGAVALGEVLVIMVGEIDLFLGMSGCFVGIMCGVVCEKLGLSLVLCLLIGLMVGGLVDM